MYTVTWLSMVTPNWALECYLTYVVAQLVDRLVPYGKVRSAHLGLCLVQCNWVVFGIPVSSHFPKTQGILEIEPK